MDDDLEQDFQTPEPKAEATDDKKSVWDSIYLYKMPNLTPEQLNGFSKYKYSSVDTSPLSKYVMHPLWNWGVTFFPTWVAPNVMTFAGYICLLSYYFLLSYFDWNFRAGNDSKEVIIPGWVWFVAAILHAASHHLDGMDGKQARRTGSGSPLGELMDHGIDSNCMWMLPVSLMSVFGTNPAIGGIALHFTPFLLLTLTFNFWVSHWEKYNTGVLYLPWMFDIAQTVVVGLFFMAGFMTPMGLKNFFSDNIFPLNQMLYIVLPLGMAGSLGLSCLNVYLAVKAGTHKKDSWSEMMRPWVPYVILNFLMCSFPMVCSDAFDSHPRMWTIAYGFSFSNVVCRLMINQMSSTRCNLIEPPLVPIFIMWFLSVVLGFNPAAVLTVYTGFSICSFFHYAYVVVNDLCDHLNICAFSITTKRR